MTASPEDGWSRHVGLHRSEPATGLQREAFGACPDMHSGAAMLQPPGFAMPQQNPVGLSGPLPSLGSFPSVGSLQLDALEVEHVQRMIHESLDSNDLTRHGMHSSGVSSAAGRTPAHAESLTADCSVAMYDLRMPNQDPSMGTHGASNPHLAKGDPMHPYADESAGQPSARDWAGPAGRTVQPHSSHTSCWPDAGHALPMAKAFPAAGITSEEHCETRVLTPPSRLPQGCHPWSHAAAAGPGGMASAAAASPVGDLVSENGRRSAMGCTPAHVHAHLTGLPCSGAQTTASPFAEAGSASLVGHSSDVSCHGTEHVDEHAKVHEGHFRSEGQQGRADAAGEAPEGDRAGAVRIPSTGCRLRRASARAEAAAASRRRALSLEDVWPDQMDDATASRPRANAARQAEQAAAEGQVVKRKAGRPIAYKGDPEDPRLTKEQRRKIRRRIMNRQSAQRVRARKAKCKERSLQEIDEAGEAAKQRAVQCNCQQALQKVEPCQWQAVAEEAAAKAASEAIAWPLQPHAEFTSHLQPCQPCAAPAARGYCTFNIHDYDDILGLTAQKLE